ncbi:hypothetical protein LCGC14_1631440 [marine sediment metagenome]|uniref:Uncharacterized protein n=1 Tax=marine sediment metagenome TaxID=412755 RepID=A0A0F9IPM9_9ZZZZ
MTKKYVMRHTIKVEPNVSLGERVWGVYIDGSIVGGWHHKEHDADTLAFDLRAALTGCRKPLPEGEEGEYDRRYEAERLSRAIETMGMF